jgi:hypothetical protein
VADARLDPSPTPTGISATQTQPVAILTDGETASAAEGVVAFIGRGLTRSFGASTSVYRLATAPSRSATGQR